MLEESKDTWDLSCIVFLTLWCCGLVSYIKHLKEFSVLELQWKMLEDHLPPDLRWAPCPPHHLWMCRGCQMPRVNRFKGIHLQRLPKDLLEFMKQFEKPE